MSFARGRLMLASALLLAGLAGIESPSTAQSGGSADPAIQQGVDAWERGDYAAAVAKWRKPAAEGNADAQYNLGQAYKFGRGVTADLKQAEDWYRRAAVQGHLQGADNYGLLLFQSNRKTEAMPWLERSAARGEPRTQYYLGVALFNGDGVPRDWPRAYALMSRASAARLPAATRALAEMDKHIPADQRKRGTALAAEMKRNVPAAVASASPAPPGPAPTPRPAATPKPAASPSPPPPAPRAAPAAPAAPRPAATSAGGAWRIQLGAFGDATNADKLWARLSQRVNGLADLTPYKIKAGAVTRLQAGPIGTKAAADRLCSAVTAAGNPCIAVKQ